MNMEDLYRQMMYSPNALRSQKRFMKHVAPEMMRAMGQVESTQIGATADIMGNVLRNRGAANVAQIGDAGETHRTGMKESGATLRDELQIAGAKALKQMEESGLYGRQSMAQKYGRSMMDREDFLKDRSFRNTFSLLGSYTEPATGTSEQDIRDAIESSFVTDQNDMIGRSAEEKRRRLKEDKEKRYDWAAGGAMPSSGTGGW